MRQFIEIVKRHLLLEKSYRNGTPANAIQKIIYAYQNGTVTTSPSCYAIVGYKLKELNPPEATIRLWGLKKSDLITHADAVLQNGEVISDIPVEQYVKFGYELVFTCSFTDLKNHIESL